MKKNNQKGTSLLLTILIMAALLTIALVISRIGLQEIKLTQDISKSLIAYYAAEAGIEEAIYEDRANYLGVVDFNLIGCLDAPTDVICYNVGATGSIDNIPSDRTIQSNGSYKDIKRTIELTY